MSGFSDLHRAGDPLILPNAWDVASARCLAEAGFRALGTTSLGVAAAGGLPDGAGATSAETLRLTRSLAKLPVHLTVDIETGSVNAAVAVAAAGAAGVNMEDAMGPAQAHAALIRSVKRELPQLFVNARTDTHWQRPGDLAETLRRVRRYADAGACSCPADTPSPPCHSWACGGSAPVPCSSAPPSPPAPTQPWRSATASLYDRTFRPTRRSMPGRPPGDTSRTREAVRAAERDEVRHREHPHPP